MYIREGRCSAALFGHPVSRSRQARHHRRSSHGELWQARTGSPPGRCKQAVPARTLGTRLNLARERYSFRTIALSAVAAEAAPSLARWISGDEEATPTESRHRSTRQMLGRLEVSAQGTFTIQYDLMNGQSLKFREGKTTSSPMSLSPSRGCLSD
jgi:hypothetical protein